MKNNILKISFAFCIALFCTSCEEELETFSATSGQTAYSFDATEFNLSIPSEDLVLSIPVNVTTVASQDRSVSVAINVDDTTADTETEYSLGNIVIPAGSHMGTLDVSFDFSEISGADGDVKELSFSINPTGEDTAFFETVTIEYFREIICNDLELTIISDVWATETGFRLEQADGTVIVDDFFPWTVNSTQPQTYNVMFNLADGDYIFTLLDTYGDGQEGTGGGVTLTGSYELTCSIITHAAGSGALDNGTFEATPFTVNP